MTAFWIRVHSQLHAKPVVGRCAASLRVDPYRAIGHLVTFWGHVAQYGTNGQVSDLPDEMLERWAGWTGKRGAFAKWLREQHLDEHGRVKEWDEYAGALESRRAKERQRIAEKRQLLRNIEATQAQRLQNVATRARGNENENENGTTRAGTRSKTTATGDRVRDPVPSWVELVRQKWAEKIGPLSHGLIGKTLKPLVDQVGADAMLAGLADYLVATPGDKAKLAWFAERGAYWAKLAAQPWNDPSSGQPTERYRVVVGGGKAA